LEIKLKFLYDIRKVILKKKVHFQAFFFKCVLKKEKCQINIF